jgi:hypothetical protein
LNQAYKLGKKMKKIISILLVLFTVSLSAKEQRVVIFDVTDVVQKGIGCEVVGQSAYGFKFQENYRTASNNKFKKGDLATVQRKYIIFEPKAKCPSLDKTKIFYADGLKVSCKVTRIAREVDTYESSLLQGGGDCTALTIKSNLKELKEVEDYLKSYGD